MDTTGPIGTNARKPYLELLVADRHDKRRDAGL